MVAYLPSASDSEDDDDDFFLSEPSDLLLGLVSWSDDELGVVESPSCDLFFFQPTFFMILSVSDSCLSPLSLLSSLDEYTTAFSSCIGFMNLTGSAGEATSEAEDAEDVLRAICAGATAGLLSASLSLLLELELTLLTAACGICGSSRAIGTGTRRSASLSLLLLLVLSFLAAACGISTTIGTGLRSSSLSLLLLLLELSLLMPACGIWGIAGTGILRCSSSLSLLLLELSLRGATCGTCGRRIDTGLRCSSSLSLLLLELCLCSGLTCGVEITTGTWLTTDDDSEDDDELDLALGAENTAFTTCATGATGSESEENDDLRRTNLGFSSASYNKIRTWK
jgi:hypothetical protein